MSEQQVHLEIDLSNGRIAVASPPDYLDAVLDRLERLVPMLSAQRPATPSPPIQRLSDEHSATPAPIDAKPPAKGKGGAKPRNFNPTSLGMTGEQERELRSFFQSKAPANQGDQYLVVMEWLKRSGVRPNGMTVEDVGSALRSVGAKIPRSPSGVMTNLKSRVRNLGKGLWEISYLGEDHVRDELPEKSASRQS